MSAKSRDMAASLPCHPSLVDHSVKIRTVDSLRASGARQPEGDGIGEAALHAAPGSGVCAPCRYSVMNRSIRGSVALCSLSCLPHAVEGDGRSLIAVRRHEYVAAVDVTLERVDV